MSYYTDDPHADWDRYCEQQEREAERLPICAECEERIYDDCYYEIDGDPVCESCLIENHRKYTEDFKG